MGVTSEWDLAIHGALSGNTALSNAVVGIYTGIAPQPEDSSNPADFPYVIIGDADFVDYHTSTESGFEVITRVLTFSRSPSRKQTRDIQDLIYAALHRQEESLSVTGHSVLFIDRDGSTVDEPLDADGSWRGECEYRAIVTKNAAD